MSSLDDDTIAQVKETLFGKKAEQIEETRIKPTVIRRRRKIVEQPVEETDASALAPEDADEIPAPADTPEEALTEEEVETQTATAEVDAPSSGRYRGSRGQA
jgi:translation initiation factor IF-2